MIKKLPIVIDYQLVRNKRYGKIIFHNFSIKIDNKMIYLNVINPYYKLDFVMIPLVNNYNCIYYLKVSLPIKIKIIDDILLLPYFFTIIMNSNLSNDLDFFYNLNIFLHSININKELVNKNNFHKNFNKINSYINDLKIKDKFDNVHDLLSNNYVYLNYNFNLALILLYSENHINELKKKYKLKKRMIFLINNILEFDLIFKGSDKFQLKDHFRFIKNNKCNKNLIEGKYYYMKLSNKNLKVKILKIVDNNVFLNENKSFNLDNYDFFNYPFEFNDLLCKNNLFNELSINNDLIIFFSTKLFKTKLNIFLIEYMIKNKVENILKVNDFKSNILSISDEINIKLNTNIDYIKIKEYDINSKNFSDSLKKIDNKINLLIFLFEYYTFPFSFNNRVLDKIFEKIIYISLINYTNILNIDGLNINLKNKISEKIPIKLKSLYFNILKIYFDFINNTFNNFIFNQKLTNDFIHYEVIKIIFETKNCISDIFKTNKNNYTKLIDILKNTSLLMQVCKKIKWKNLPKKLLYLDTLIENKNYLFYNDRMNKNLVPLNFDSRLKKLIYNPFMMFKYLRKDKDFIKWVKFLDIKINEIFNNKVDLNDKNLVSLAKLIHLLVDIESQNLDDLSYNKFINFCRNNKKLILYNSRVNIKIKSCFKFLKINLNLGFISKHITSKEIELNDDKNFNKLKNLEKQLEKISKKYYKYKGKYVKLKRDTENTSSIMIYSK